jgi:hypothetical protein
MAVVQTYNVLNTLAGAADAVVVDRAIKITGAPPINFITTQKVTKSTGTAGTAEIGEIIFAVSNSVDYKFTISQQVGNQLVSVPFIYHADASATDLEIATAIKNAINRSNLEITAAIVSGTPDTVTLTASSSYPVFTFTAVENITYDNSSTGFNAGVAPQLTSAQLAAAGIEGTVAGQVYDSLEIVWAEATSASTGKADSILRKHVVYWDADATNYAAFKAQLEEVFEAAESASPFTIVTENFSVPGSETIA